MPSQRTFDLSLALLLFVPSFLICSAAALIIWIECRANPLFVQTRVGLHCKPFKLFKLRTMHPDTVDAASHHVSQAQILRFGKLFRASKIDELPQLLNILSGTMSFVGPRPCLPLQVELIAERKKRGVMDLLPGITGISQVAGIDMSDPVRLALSDAEYVKRRSMVLYFKCLGSTFLGRGSGDAVKNV